MPRTACGSTSRVAAAPSRPGDASNGTDAVDDVGLDAFGGDALPFGVDALRFGVGAGGVRRGAGVREPPSSRRSRVRIPPSFAIREPYRDANGVPTPKSRHPVRCCVSEWD